VARLLRGQREEIAVQLMEHLRRLTADGVPRVYQARLPEQRFLTVSDVVAKGRRMLLVQAPAMYSSFRRVSLVISRPRRIPATQPWFTGLTPQEHRAAVSQLAYAVESANYDFEPVPGATTFDPTAPVPDGAPGADAVLDDAAIRHAWATDAPAPGRDPALTSVVVSASALGLAMLATMIGAALAPLSADLLSAGALAALVLGVVAGIAGVVAAALGPERTGPRAGGVMFALIGWVAVLPATLQLLESTAGAVVVWALSAIMFLLAWANATGVYGLWWLSIALPGVACAVGAPVGAVLDGDTTGWGYVLGAGLVLLATALAVATLLRSPTLVPHRRAALAELRRLAADAGSPVAPGAR